MVDKSMSRTYIRLKYLLFQGGTNALHTLKKSMLRDWTMNNCGG